MKTRFTGILLSCLLLACSANTWQAIGQVASTLGGTPTSAGFADGGAELLLFGGSGHQTFLGCLNCSATSTSSVLNSTSQYGSAVFLNSIYSKSGQFGSSWSTYSACNQIATDPPVIVDRAGKFYGRLTLNTTRTDAVRDTNIRSWLLGVCGG